MTEIGEQVEHSHKFRNVHHFTVMHPLKHEKYTYTTLQHNGI